MADPKKPYAAIDIGTNSAHLVIAEYDDKRGLRVLDTDKVTLRLGQAFDKQGNITADGIARTVEAVAHMCEIVSPYKAGIRAVATHAIRQAKNQAELCDAVKAKTGVTIEIIDGIEEARLVFLGMRQGLPISGVSCLGVDVGGGSTEIIAARDDDIACVSSVKLGAVTLTARFLDPEDPTDSQIEDMEHHIKTRLAPVLRELTTDDFKRALASSGTAKALAFIHNRTQGSRTMEDPNGYSLTRDCIESVYQTVKKAKQPKKIRKSLGIDQSRSEIILAGAAILKEVTHLLSIDQWTVTTYGLREGIVVDTYEREVESQGTSVEDVQWRGVVSFAKRLGLERKHAEQMTKLTTLLYKQLKPVFGSIPEHPLDLRILQAAAYLHDAGKFISAPQYHKHSHYLISNGHLPGFTESERLFMGLITRFQRKKIPSSEEKICSEMSSAELRKLKIFSGIIRLASALDRTRRNKITNLTASVDGSQLKFVFHYAGEMPEVELHKVKIERQALESSFDKTVTFEAAEQGSI